MNVLILTNHLVELCGSEIQVLEIYNYFKERDHNILVYANILGDPIIEYFDKNDLITNLEQINLENINFIWSQHCMIARLFQNHIHKNVDLKLISVHLSPYEMMELCSLPYMKLLDCIYVANSKETKDKLVSLGIESNNIFISNNCAPSKYLDNSIKETKLNNILVVSNHLPQEMIEATNILSKDFNVNIIGGKKAVLVTPELIKQYDMIITIGKTVQYGLLSNIPVYCYDHFGGPGFLNFENYEVAKYYNFSGRGFEKKTAEEIVLEVRDNFQFSVDFFNKFSKKSDFILEYFMDNLFLQNKKCILTKKKQQLLLPFVPFEKKIAELYSLMKKEQHYTSHLLLEMVKLKTELHGKEEKLTKFSKELYFTKEKLINFSKELYLANKKINYKESKIIKLKKEKQKLKRKLKKIQIIFLLALTMLLVSIYKLI